MRRRRIPDPIADRPHLTRKTAAQRATESDPGRAPCSVPRRLAERPEQPPSKTV